MHVLEKRSLRTVKSKYSFAVVERVHSNYVKRGLSHKQAYELLSRVVGHDLAAMAYLSC